MICFFFRCFCGVQLYLLLLPVYCRRSMQRMCMCMCAILAVVVTAVSMFVVYVAIVATNATTAATAAAAVVGNVDVFVVAVTADVFGFCI